MVVRGFVSVGFAVGPVGEAMGKASSAPHQINQINIMSEFQHHYDLYKIPLMRGALDGFPNPPVGKPDTYKEDPSGGGKWGGERV